MVTKERFPNILRVFIIFYHIVGVLLLVAALVAGVIIGAGQNETSGNNRFSENSGWMPILFLGIALVFSLVYSGVLDAGLNKNKDGALLASAFLWLIPAIFSGLLFIFNDITAISGIIACVGCAAFLFEALLLIPAFKCAKENLPKRWKKRTVSFLPKSIKGIAVFVFLLALALIAASTVILFLNETAVVLHLTLEFVCILAWVISLIATFLYDSGCRNNMVGRLAGALVLAIIALVMIGTLLAVSYPLVLQGNQGSIANNMVETGYCICCAGVGMLTFAVFFTFISIYIVGQGPKKKERVLYYEEEEYRRACADSDPTWWLK